MVMEGFFGGAPKPISVDTNGNVNVNVLSGGGGGGGSIAPFAPVGQATRTVSTTASNIALPTADPTVLIENTGANDAFFNLGVGAGTTASTTNFRLTAGHSLVVTAGANTYLAAITASGTTSLAITTGTGTPVLTGGGGGGAGGAVTISGSLPAGTNALGSVTLGGALPTGGNTIGAISNTAFGVAAGAADIGTIHLGTGAAAIGSITNTGFALTSAIPTGANSIGSVTLGAALPAGGNTVGAISNTGFALTSSIPSGVNSIGSVTLGAALPAGGNTIGAISNAGFNLTSAIPTGANTIGTVNIGTAPTITVSGAYPADVSATGQSLASTLNAAYTLTLANGQGVTTFAVTGLTASAATLTIEASDDAGTTWAAVNGIAPATGALFTTLTADQQFRVNSAGRTKLRLRVSTAGSGTITVASNISTATSAVALSSPIPAGGNNIGQVSLAASSLGATRKFNSSTLTRIANTTAYAGTSTSPVMVCLFTSVTACAPLTLTVSSTATVNGLILNIGLIKSSTGATGATFIVRAYQAAPTLTSVFDTTVYTPKYADNAAKIGTWTCGSQVVNGDNSSYECISDAPDAHRGFNLTDGTLRFIVEATGAYVPTSGETFVVTADIVASAP
jgi:hypothetical protein